MDEKLQRLIEKQKTLCKDLAETQVANAIGEATLALLARKETLTLTSLTQTLIQQVAQLPERNLLRQRNEAALKALRAACQPAP